MVGGVPYQVKKAGTAPLTLDFTIDNVTYSVKMADLNTNRVSSTQHLGVTSALVDHGATRGIAGGVCHVVKINDQPQRFVNVKGIDGCVKEPRRLVMAGAVTQSNRGPIILLMNQYAHSRKGHSIHFPPQLEWNEVNDKSTRVGKQRFLTFDGFSIPINIRRGLCCLDMQPFTEAEWEDLPHILLTQDANWDPRILDHKYGNDPE
jgi:hypothetical protein